MKFKDKVCIITGGSGGIGKDICEKFLSEGAKVINLDIAHPKSYPNINYEYISCDLKESGEINKVILQITEKYKKVDFLINNACYNNRGIISNCDAKSFNEVLQVGVTAPYLLTQGFANIFSKEGSVVNIASTRGMMSQADTESYSAAKGGIIALTHALSVSLSGRIRVNAISPGWIDTSNSLLDREDHLQHPVGRVGVPNDISQMVMFLCSEASGFITGQNYVIDGGMSKNMIYHNDHGWQYKVES